jgi:fatty acid desaturase
MKSGHAQSWWNKALGLTIGNLLQGFSVAWWKDKHNRHHAVPNVQGSGDFLKGDPDVDTMPLLAWSMEMAKLAEDDVKGQRFLKMQKYTYLPLLCFARIVWLQSSFQFAWGVREAEEDTDGGGGGGLFNNALKSDALARMQAVALTKTERVVEVALLIVHHALTAVLCLQRPSIYSAIAFWMLANSIASFLIFVITGNGHNGMSTYTEETRPDYWKLQVTTTRNISGGAFVHWLCGGLEYQVDHHLFPMMPRHSLPRAHDIIVAFCKEHDVEYAEASLVDGVVEVIKHLDDVSREFFTEFPAL